MIEDFEDWRLKCLMLVKHWHHIEPSRISETLLRITGRTRRQSTRPSVFGSHAALVG